MIEDVVELHGEGVALFGLGGVNYSDVQPSTERMIHPDIHVSPFIPASFLYNLDQLPVPTTTPLLHKIKNHPCQSILPCVLQLPQPHFREITSAS
jgi:hypothetical protein